MALRSDFEAGITIGNNQETLNILNSENGTNVEIPHGSFFLDAEYARNGQDLVLTDEHGREVTVEGYFTNSPLPDLVNEAGARVEGAFVAKLAGPGQVAQSGGQATALGEPVGAVETLEGSATVRHKDGTSEKLEIGDDIYQDDIIETTGNGNLGILMKDGSIMGVGPGSRMTIDNFVYDSGSNDGNVGLSFLKGAVSFVSGKIAKNDYEDVNIKVPFGSIGIRGTEFVVETGPDGIATVYVLEGRVVTISNGQQVVLEPGDLVSITATGLSPIQQMPLEQIQAKFKEVLRAQEDTRNIRDGRADLDGGSDLDVQPAAGGNQQAADDNEGSEEDGGSSEQQEAGRDEDLELDRFDPNLDSDQVGVVDLGVPFNNTPPTVTVFTTDDENDEIPGGSITFFGGPGDDVFSGGNFGDLIVGVGGNDDLSGEGGNDSIDGGKGDDTVDGGTGNDFLQGGKGSVDILLGGEGDDLIYGDIQNDDDPTEGDLDTLHGGDGADTLYGGGGDDLLYGDDGNDQLSGGYGADEIHGGAGDDVMSGGAGNDKLYGDAGRDNLDGGEGDDLLVGGAGADQIDGGTGSDIAVYSGNLVDYTIGLQDNQFTVFDSSEGAVDRLSNVEKLRFDDGDFALVTFSITGDGNVAEGEVSSYSLDLSGTPLSDGQTASTLISFNDIDTDDDVSNLFTALSFAADNTPGVSVASLDEGIQVTFTGGVGNATSLAFDLNAFDDEEIEALEDFSIQISPQNTSDSIAFADQASVTTTIEDSPFAQFYIGGVDEIAEGAEGGFVIGYNGNIPDGETVSIAVNFSSGNTDAGDLEDFFAALQAAADSTDGVSFVTDSETTRLVFDNRATELDFTLEAFNDTLTEGDESFSVSITNPISPSGVVTVSIENSNEEVSTRIIDGDAVGIILSGPASVSEGESAAYSITIDGDIPAGETISVDLSILDGPTNSASDNDYSDLEAALAASASETPGVIADGTTLIFNSTASSFNFSLEIFGEDGLEGNEDYVVRLSNISLSNDGQIVAVGGGEITTTIVEPSDITFSLTGDSSVIEGENADYTIGYTGTLAVGASASVEVNFDSGETDEFDIQELFGALQAAADATEGVSLSGNVLTFNSTQDTLAFSLTSALDDLTEGNEPFTISLSEDLSSPVEAFVDPSNASITTSVLDIDPIRIDLTGDTSVEEGGNAQYTIGVDGFIPEGHTISVDVSVQNGTTDGTDYGNLLAALSAAASTTPGVSVDGNTVIFDHTAFSFSFDLPISADGTGEGNETFSIVLSDLDLSNTGGIGFDGPNSIETTITEPSNVVFSINGDTNPTEGFTATYTVGYTGVIAAGETASVRIAFNEDSADFQDLDDFIFALQGAADSTAGVTFDGDDMLTFDSMSGPLTFSVGITEDGLTEGDETFSVSLFGPSATSGAASINPLANETVTQINDPDIFRFEISGDTSAQEGKEADYEIDLFGLLPPGETASVDVVIQDITTDSADYANLVAVLANVASFTDGVTASGNTLTFDSTATSFSFSLDITEFDGIEGTENFTILLDNLSASNGGVVGVVGTGEVNTEITEVIEVQIGFAETEVVEEEGQTARFNIELSGPFGPGSTSLPTGAEIVFSLALLNIDTNSADFLGSLADFVDSFPIGVDVTSLDEGIEITITDQAVFNDGVLTLPVDVATVGGDTLEPDEGFTLEIDSVMGMGVDVTVGNLTATGTLTDDGNAPTGPTPGDDIIVGTAAAETIDALAGNDSVSGGEGDDTLLGSQGHDTLEGEGGFDSLLGGEGDDTLLGGSGNDTLRGGSGDDSLDGGEDSGLLEGGAGNDILRGGSDADTLLGGEGRDELRGRDGNDRLEGDVGDDFLAGENGNDTVIGGNGADSVIGGNGNDQLIGDAGNDTIHGGNDDDFLYGGQGDDSLLGDAGNDTYYFGLNSGTDFVEDDRGSNLFIFEEFDGALRIFNGDAEFYQKDGGQVLVRDYDVSTIDFIEVTFGGIDETRLFNLAKTSIGGDGDDYVFGIKNSIANLFGGAGDDLMTGGDFNDRLNGEEGDDILHDTEGFNTLDGGLGFDIASYHGGDAISAHLSSVSTVDHGPATDLLIDVEKVIGSEFNDVFTADIDFEGSNGSFNAFEGREGDDTISGNGNTRIEYRFADGGVLVDLGVGFGQGAAGPNGATNVGFDDILGGVTQVVGSSFDDVLLGGADDYFEGFRGGAGDDTIDGVGGFDRASYQFAASGILATFSSVTDDDAIVSNDGFGGTDELIDIDEIEGSAFNDTLNGGDFDDRFIGRAGDDLIDGGAGHDIARYDRSDQTNAVHVDLSQNRAFDDGFGFEDTLIGIEEVRGGALDDMLIGDDFANRLRGNDGMDQLAGNDGNDTLDGGYGADTLAGGAGDDTYILRANYGADVISDVSGADHIYIDDFSHVERNGTSVVFYHEENAQLTVTNYDVGSSVVSATLGLRNGERFFNLDRTGLGTAGDDLIIGTAAGSEIFEGGAGDDLIFGGAGFDFLSGGAGEDILVGEGGNNTLDGGAGFDTASYRDHDVAINLSGTEGGFIDIFHGALSVDLITNVEVFEGTDFNDTLSAGEDGLWLIGGAGDDSITGGTGQDTIDGTIGNDTLDGGAGFDDLVFDSTPVGISIVATDSSSGTAMVGADTMTYSNFERIFGSNHDDTMTGSSGHNQFFGQDGDDSLLGLNGNDFLDGGAGSDTILGGDGNDSLVGGEGSDILTGGASFDFFAFNGQNEATQVATNGTFSGSSDEITDFGVGGDIIQLLEDFDFTDGYNAFDDFLTTVGGQAYDGTNADYSGGQTAGEAKVIFDGTHLYYDSNGNNDGYTVVARISSGTVDGTDITTSIGGA